MTAGQGSTANVRAIQPKAAANWRDWALLVDIEAGRMMWS